MKMNNMAQLLGNGQLKLNDGKIITPTEGGWYDATRYLNGKLLAPNEYEPGKQVSAEVNAQSAKAQGVSQQQFNTYLTNQGATQNNNNNNGMPVNNGGGSAMPQQPAINVQDIYNSSYKTPEIESANQEIQKKVQEIEQRKKQLADAEAKINDNPFYSESTLLGKVSKLRQSAQKDLDNLNGELTGLQNKLNTLRSDAETKVNIAFKQYDVNQQSYQNAINQLNTLIQSGALANASASDLASISSTTGISPSMLQNVANSSRSANTMITTTTDNNGNLTVLAIDKNTGAVLNTQTVGGVGKSSNNKKSSSNDQISSASYMIQLYNNTNKNNPSWAKGHALRQNFSPKDFYQQLLLDYPAAADYVKKVYAQQNSGNDLNY